LAVKLLIENTAADLLYAAEAKLPYKYKLHGAISQKALIFT
jgi:hypothetical protein